MKSIAVSHKGKRNINQDLILKHTAIDGSYLFAVIDGMGGYESGEIAAKIVGENIETYMSTVGTIDAFHVQKAINKSNLAIRQQKIRMTNNMGATIGGVILKGTVATYFWIGDVKIFHFRNKKLLFESTPHSLVNNLIANGSITEPSQLSKYRHVVTRSVSGDLLHSKADFIKGDYVAKKDDILICSDGVHNLFDSIQIENLVSKISGKEEIIEFLNRRLLKEASDNYSLIIL